MLTAGNASMSLSGGHEDTGGSSPYEGTFDWKGLTEFPSENTLSKYSSLSFIHNPILTLKTLPTLPYLTDLCLDYTLIESLEEARPQPRLTSVSFNNSPISKLNFLNIMCIIMFGDSVREVNGNILDTNEIQEGIHLRSCLRTHIFSGYIILSLQPIQLKHIRTQEIKPITPFYSQIAPPMVMIQPNFPQETLPEVMDLPKFRFPTRSEVSSATPTPTTGTYHPFSSSPPNPVPKKKKKKGKRKHHHKNNYPTYESNTGTFQDNFEYYDNSKGIPVPKPFIPPSDSDDCPTMVAKLILPSNNQILDSMSSDEGVSGVYSVASHKPKNWRDVLIHHSPSMSRQQLSPRYTGAVTVSEGVWNSPPKYQTINHSDFNPMVPRYEAPPKTTEPSDHNLADYKNSERGEIKNSPIGNRKKKFRYVKRKKSKKSKIENEIPKQTLPTPPPLPVFQPHLIEAPVDFPPEIKSPSDSSSQNSSKKIINYVAGSSCSSQKPAPALQVPPAFNPILSNYTPPDNEPASSSMLPNSSSYSSSSADDEDEDSLSTMGSSSDDEDDKVKKCQGILSSGLIAQKGHSSGYEGDSSSAHQTEDDEDQNMPRGQLPPPPPLAVPQPQAETEKPEVESKVSENAHKRASSSDEPPHTILDFGTIKIEPPSQPPKPRAKRRRGVKRRAAKKKRSGAPELAIPSTPVLDGLKRPRRVMRSATQTSDKHVPRVAYEGRTEIYDTEDESSGDDEHPQFRKVNFFKLIGIEPDSDDEYMSGDDLDAARRDREEEDIDGPEDVVAQLRAQGRARFYQMRTVETSTLEEMEKFVTNYVKANLDRYE